MGISNIAVLFILCFAKCESLNNTRTMMTVQSTSKKQSIAATKLRSTQNSQSLTPSKSTLMLVKDTFTTSPVSSLHMLTTHVLINTLRQSSSTTNREMSQPITSTNRIATPQTKSTTLIPSRSSDKLQTLNAATSSVHSLPETSTSVINSITISYEQKSLFETIFSTTKSSALSGFRASTSIGIVSSSTQLMRSASSNHQPTSRHADSSVVALKTKITSLITPTFSIYSSTSSSETLNIESLYKSTITVVMPSSPSVLDNFSSSENIGMSTTSLTSMSISASIHSAKSRTIDVLPISSVPISTSLSTSFRKADGNSTSRTPKATLVSETQASTIKVVDSLTPMVSKTEQQTPVTKIVSSTNVVPATSFPVSSSRTAVPGGKAKVNKRKLSTVEKIGIRVACICLLLLLFFFVLFVLKKQRSDRRNKYKLYNDMHIPGFSDLGGTVHMAEINNDVFSYEDIDALDRGVNSLYEAEESNKNGDELDYD